MTNIFWSLVILVSSVSFIANASMPSAIKAKNELSKSLQLDNGMKVIIISDKKAKQSSASLTIGAGQRHSPADIEGLPHLLEHAVFLGSNNYPNKNDWDNFIKSNGGWSNGSTRTDNTRYHFQINNTNYKEALNRFFDKIFYPVLSQESIEISVSEIDEEYLSRKNDDWQGILSVIRETTSSKNSARTFGIGNKTTLGNDIGLLQSKLRIFHKQHYQPENMALAIYTSLPLAEAETLVKSVFVAEQSMISKKGPTPPLHDKEDLERLIAIDSPNNRHSLDIRFEVPVMHKGNNKNVAAYIAHLLGHESEGSIYNYLKKHELAHSLSVAFQGDSHNEVLDLYIDLTEKGALSHNHVLQVVFDYISMLNMVEHSEHIQNELLITANRILELPIQQEAGDWLSDISDNALLIGSIDAITYGMEFTPATTADIKKYLSFFSKRNVQVYFASPDNIVTPHTTKHYERKYNVLPLAVNNKNNSDLKEQPLLHLPKQNKYLSAVVTKEANPPIFSSIKYNEVFNLDDGLLIHYKHPDTSLFVENTSHTLLLAEHIKSSLEKNTYFASLANYDATVEINENSIGIIFSGPESNLLIYAYDTIVGLLPTLSETSFKSYKAKAKYSYEDILYEQSYKQAMKEVDNAMRFLPGVEAMPEQIESIPFGQYKAFIKDLRGNLTVFSSKKNNKLTGYFVNRQTSAVFNEIPYKSEKSIIVKGAASGNAISYTLISPENNVFYESRLRLLEAVTENRFIELMRQKEKVAYISGVVFVQSTTPSLSFVVESSDTNKQKLKDLTTMFLANEVATSFEEITDVQLAEFKAIAIDSLITKQTTAEYLSMLSYQYSAGNVNFTRHKDVASAINEISKEELLAFLKTYVSRLN